MTSVQIFMNDISNVNKYIQTRNENSQKQIYTYYCAARCIQRHFRGYMTRQYLKTLHIAAINIQKVWKGKMGRREFIRALEAQQAESVQNSYNAQATLIQKTWQGYLSRKQKFDYYHYKEYLKKVVQINKSTLQDLQNHRMILVQAARDECKMEAAIKRDKLLSSLHYAIRTELTPGILSLLGSSELSVVEKLISAFKAPRVKRVEPKIEEEIVQKIGKTIPGPFFPYEEVIRRKNLKPQPPKEL